MFEFYWVFFFVSRGYCLVIGLFIFSDFGMLWFSGRVDVGYVLGFVLF